MSEFVQTKLPCPCGQSSDAYAINADGWGTCFSCDERFPPENAEAGEHMTARKDTAPLIQDLAYRPLTTRGLSQEVCKKYGYGIGDYHGSAVQVAPVHNAAGKVVAQKIRTADKDFRVLGALDDAGLFGQQLARKGGKMIVITEGEIDAMSVCQAMGLSWPAVSITRGASGAKREIAAQLEFLETYDKVVLAFDNDEPGKKAAEEVVELFSPGRVAIADLGGFKDANEMVAAGEQKALRDAIWSAREWRPDGVVNLADLRERVEKKLSMGTLYPWAGLNDMLYGFRPQELITWTAGTGSGKSAVVSEIAYHLIMKEHRVGLIYLEEGVDRAGKRLVGLHMGKPIHLPGVSYTAEDFGAAWDATLGTGRVFAYDHFGSLDEDVLLNRIRYMVKALGVETVILDHISMVVSGADLDADERRLLDYTMTKLRQLTQETGVSAHVVSHLRRPPGAGSHEEGRQVSLSHLRGTQAIAQLSDAVIALERDQQADDEEERNTTTLRVLKNRYAGLTGKACRLFYNRETGRLEDLDDAFRGGDDDF